MKQTQIVWEVVHSLHCQKQKLHTHNTQHSIQTKTDIGDSGAVGDVTN